MYRMLCISTRTQNTWTQRIHSHTHTQSRWHTSHAATHTNANPLRVQYSILGIFMYIHTHIRIQIIADALVWYMANGALVYMCVCVLKRLCVVCHCVCGSSIINMCVRCAWSSFDRLCPCSCVVCIFYTWEANCVWDALIAEEKKSDSKPACVSLLARSNVRTQFRFSGYERSCVAMACRPGALSDRFGKSCRFVTKIFLCLFFCLVLFCFRQRERESDDDE